MGMYTKLDLDVELRSDMPNEAVMILELMCSNCDVKKMIVDVQHLIFIRPDLDHKLFKTSRGLRQLRCDSSYFDNWKPPRFTRGTPHLFEVHFNVKNYENTIQLLLDWLNPFLIDYKDYTVVGSYKYELDEQDSDVVVIENKLCIINQFDSDY
jgi:hypothetical protein